MQYFFYNFWKIFSGGGKLRASFFKKTEMKMAEFHRATLWLNPQMIRSWASNGLLMGSTKVRHAGGWDAAYRQKPAGG